MPERLFTIYQVADLLGATPGAVMEWVRRGWMPIQQLGDGSTRVSERGMVKFLRQQGIDIEKMLQRITQREAAAGASQAAVAQPSQAEPDQAARATRWRPSDQRAGSVPRQQPIALPDGGDRQGDQPNQAPLPQQPALTAAAATRSQGSSPGGDGRDAGAADGRAGVAAGDTPAPQQSAVFQQPTGPPPQQPTAPQQVGGATRQVPRAETSPAAQVAEAILDDAARRGASAVHLDRTAGRMSLRLRVEGVLQDKPHFDARLPDRLRAQLPEHFIGLAGGGGNNEKAGSGQFVCQLQQGVRNIRAHWAKLADGLRLVLHLDGPGPDLAALGATPQQRQLLAGLVGGSGMVLVTGLSPQRRREVIEALVRNTRLDSAAVLAVGGDAWPAELARSLGGGADKAALIASAAGLDADLLIVEELDHPAVAAAAMAAARGGAAMLAGVRAADGADACELMAQMSCGGWRAAAAVIGIVEHAALRRRCESCGGSGCPRCGASGWAGLVHLMNVLSGAALRAALANSPAPAVAIAKPAPDRTTLAEMARAMADAGAFEPTELARAGLAGRAGGE